MWSFNSTDKITKFRDAVQSGKIKEVEDILTSNPSLLKQAINPGKLGFLSDVIEAVVPGAQQIKDVIYQDNRESMGYTALHWAARCGQFEMCDYLIKEGIPVDMGNKIGNTPLHVAIYYNQPKIVELLLQKGADPSIGNTGGIFVNEINFTPLHYAVMYGSLQDVSLLVKYWKQNAKNQSTEMYSKVTPLHIAVGLVSPEKLNVLLQGGFDPNCLSAQEQTPLHLAILMLPTHKAEAVNMIQSLIDKGARANIPDEYGKTAYGLIMSYLTHDCELTATDLFKIVFRNSLLNTSELTNATPTLTATSHNTSNSTNTSCVSSTSNASTSSSSNTGFSPPPPPPPLPLEFFGSKKPTVTSTKKTTRPLPTPPVPLQASPLSEMDQLMNAIRDQVEKRRMSIVGDDENTQEQTEEEKKAWGYKS